MTNASRIELAFDYQDVLLDLYRRRSVLDKAVAALAWLSGQSKCEPLARDLPAIYRGKWIAVDRSGEWESIVAYGDTPQEAEALARRAGYPKASVREA